jgi:hypothetical protein
MSQNDWSVLTSPSLDNNEVGNHIGASYPRHMYSRMPSGWHSDRSTSCKHMVVYNKGEPLIFLYITLGILLTLDPKSQSVFLKV